MVDINRTMLAKTVESAGASQDHWRDVLCLACRNLKLKEDHISVQMQAELLIGRYGLLWIHGLAFE